MVPDLHSKHPHRYFLFVHHEPQSRRCRVSSSHISSEPLACNVSSDLIFQLATSFYDLEQFIHPANIGIFFQCAKKKDEKKCFIPKLLNHEVRLFSSLRHANHQYSIVWPCGRQIDPQRRHGFSHTFR